MSRFHAGVAVLAALVAVVGVAATAGVAQARVAFCHGHRANIVGGPGNNVLRGTRHADVIAAGRGHDIVLGRKGKDLICGGPGNDDLDGGRGQDVVYGGKGRDLCFAPTAAEHMLHHHCEVHVGAPPRKPRGQFRSSVFPAQVASVAQAGAEECNENVCFAGVPVCGKDASGPVIATAAPWPQGDTGIPPIAVSLYGGGKIAVSMEVGAYDEFNHLGVVYGPGPVTTYSGLSASTTYYVPPNPSHIPDPANSSGAEIVWMWFNEWNPSTGQWGGWFWKTATTYEDPPISDNAGQCLNLGGF